MRNRIRIGRPRGNLLTPFAAPSRDVSTLLPRAIVAPRIVVAPQIVPANPSAGPPIQRRRTIGRTLQGVNAGAGQDFSTVFGLARHARRERGKQPTPKPWEFGTIVRRGATVPMQYPGVVACKSTLLLQRADRRLANRPTATLRRTRIDLRWIDPADIAVGAPIDDVHPAAAAVLKHDHRRAGEIQFHHRLTH